VAVIGLSALVFAGLPTIPTPVLVVCMLALAVGAFTRGRNDRRRVEMFALAGAVLFILPTLLLLNWMRTQEPGTLPPAWFLADVALVGVGAVAAAMIRQRKPRVTLLLLLTLNSVVIGVVAIFDVGIAFLAASILFGSALAASLRSLRSARR